ncbi:PP2C family serine/threonine-protein phosphatase [uncultured Oxalicibacterium sp.]|uniref:PP2C family protein-serine/threonine phosphatase n=1 Tax=uncultured Oxalicibacterium sp. TaxID=1168540 RepID=UPI0025E5D014|nr:PP2C family serine/threonine-protein phosphatase [uncultured Oxalicibacterium sp.]
MSQYKIEAGTGQHIGDRAEQQDRMALLTAPKAPGYMLAVMADGMGGSSGGTLAAEQVVHTAQQVFERFSPLTDEPAAILHEIAREADIVIRLSALTNDEKPHSTVVLLMITPKGEAICGHAGDSRLYRFSGPNCLFKTRDHTYQESLAARDPEAAKQIDPAKAHLLVHFLGGRQKNVQLEVAHQPNLAVGDAFLLCTDGLWQYFSDAELGAAIATHAPRQACEMLVHKARERGKNRNADNCSLIVIKIAQAEEKASAVKARSMRRAV